MSLNDFQTVEDVVVALLLQPERFWPEKTHFHSRNIEKLTNACRGLGVQDAEFVVSNIMPGLRSRAQDGHRTLYAISTGGSGCHFLGSILHGSPGYFMVGEVYFPEGLLKVVETFEDPLDKRLLIDCVSVLHTGNLDRINSSTIPVNVMHLRPDSPLDQIATYTPQARTAALIRNPYDIAVSRSFRKEDYRLATDPDADDEAYARKQARHVNNFFRRSKTVRYDYIVRYEDLAARTEQAVFDMMRVLDYPSKKIRPAKLRFDNHNTRPKDEVPADLGQIIYQTLKLQASHWGYDLPRYIRLPDLSAPRFWSPSEAETVTAQNRKILEEEDKIVPFSKMEAMSYPIDFDAVPSLDRTETWHMYFWCLGWLFLYDTISPSGELCRDEFVRSIDALEPLCTDPSNAPKRVWDDHATAYRSASLLKLVARFYDDPEIRDRQSKLIFIFQVHLDQLEDFIKSDRWRNNNHAIFHCLAYFNILKNADPWLFDRLDFKLSRAYLTERLETAVSGVIDFETGISREQSMLYHIWSYGLLKGISNFLVENEITLAFDHKDLIEKLLAFGEFTLISNNTLPALGDTAYGNSYDFGKLQDIRNNNPDIGVRGAVALGQVVREGEFFRLQAPDDEFTMLRRGARAETLPDPDEPLADDLIVLRTAKERLSHGHFDGLAVWATLGGDPVLIDSGGPYKYGDALRASYFMQNIAHNTVVVDAKPYQAEVETLLSTDALCAGCIENNSGMRHERFVLSNTPGEVIIVDRLHSTDGEAHFCDAIFRFDPDAKLETLTARVDSAELALEVFGRERRILSYWHASAGRMALFDPLKPAYLAEQSDPLISVVTPGPNKTTGAPGYLCKTQGTQILMVNVVEGLAKIQTLTIENGESPSPTLCITYAHADPVTFTLPPAVPV